MVNLEFLRTNEIKTGSNQEVVNYIDNLLKNTSDIYLDHHKDWYINDRFVKGEHWIIYNKTLNKVQSIPVSTGEVRRTVNKIRSQIRGVKNFIKRSQPRWEVHPDNASDKAYKEAESKNKILQNIYRTKQIKGSLTDLITNGLKYSVGFLEGGYVKNGEREEINFWVDSSYDIFPDPSAKDIKSCRYVIKTSAKPVESVLNNKSYNIVDKNLSESKKAASDYKDLLEREEKGTDIASGGVSDLDTVIVKELWLQWIDKYGKPKVRVITVIGNNVARVYDPKYRRIPIFEYKPEKTAGQIFGTPWIKDLISLNKSLDKTASQVEAYIQRMLAGKYLIKKGTEVSTITDKGAEKIYYKGAVAPRQLDLQPLPSTPFTAMTDSERWIEELGGVRDASLGRSSGSLQSGRGIEALQSADAGTVAEPIENLELFLQEVGEFVLGLIADYGATVDAITENGGDIKFTGAINDGNIDGVVKITGNEEVKVTTVPEISYSEDVKRDLLMRLAEMQLIDPQTFLEQLKFSNVSEIIQRVEKHREEEFKKDMMKQRESHRTDGMGPEDTADLADQENMQMAAGQSIPATPKALWTPEHLELHMAFIGENKDAYQQNMDLFDQHILQEEQYGNENIKTAPLI